MEHTPKASGTYDERARRLVAQFERLASDRSKWEALWNDISRRFRTGVIEDFGARGWKNYNSGTTSRYIFDSRPVNAAKRCAAIMESQITPRMQMWCRFEPEDLELLDDQDVLAYYDDIAQIVARHLTSAEGNFSEANQQVLLDLVLYGTGVLFVDELQGDIGVRFRAIHLSEIFLAQNHQQRINQAFRVFSLTAREAVQEKRWKLPDKIVKAATDTPEERFRFLHCVVPRDDVSTVRVDYKGKPFASYYVSMDGCQIISEGGYDEFPYAVARFSRESGEIYGNSPAMDALPSTKMLNEMKKSEIKTVHRQADPVLLLFDDDELEGFDMAPGALNFGGIDAEGRARVGTLPTGDTRAMKDLGQSELDAIEEAFFVRLFQVLTRTNEEMTATQAQFREKEKAQLLAPPIAAVQDGYCGPLAVRVVSVLAPQFVFPLPPPQVAQNSRYRTVYDSPSAAILRAGQAAGVMQAAEYLANMSSLTGDPGYADRLDSDEIGKELPIMLGSVGRFIRSDEKVAEIQAARAEAEKQKAVRDAAPGAAALTSAAAKMATATGGGARGA